MNQLAHGRTKAFPQGEGPSEDGQREEGQQNANTRADDLLSQEHDERTAAPYRATWRVSGVASHRATDGVGCREMLRQRRLTARQTELARASGAPEAGPGEDAIIFTPRAGPPSGLGSLAFAALARRPRVLAASADSNPRELRAKGGS